MDENKWIRIKGKAVIERNEIAINGILERYPQLDRKYGKGNTESMAFVKLNVEEISMN